MKETGNSSETKRLRRRGRQRFSRREPDIPKFIEEKDIEGLTGALTHGNETIRSSAVTALGDIGGEDLIEPVSKVLNDRVSGVRIDAVTALSKLDGEEVVKPISGKLTDDSLDVRQAAMAVLIELPPDPEVIPLLRDATSRDHSGATYNRWYEDEYFKENPNAFAITKNGREKMDVWDANKYQEAKNKVEENFHKMNLLAITIAEKVGNQSAIAFIQDQYADRHSTDEIKGECINALSRLKASPPQEILKLARRETDDIDWDIVRGRGGYEEYERGVFDYENEKVDETAAALLILSLFVYDNGETEEGKKGKEKEEPEKTNEEDPWEIITNALSHPEHEMKIAAAKALKRTKNQKAIPLLQEALESGPYIYSVYDKEEGSRMVDATEEVELELYKAIKVIQANNT